MLAAAPALGAEATLGSEPPVVIVIQAAKSTEARRREAKLFDELTFALDDFMLMRQDAEAPNFSELGLSDQIASVLPVAQANGASAVVWLAFPLPRQVMLHVVALGPGRALVRTIESDRTPATERAMALMARELLGAAYLFSPPKEVPTGVREVVRDVKQQIASLEEPAPPPPPEAPSARWSLWLQAATGYPVLGNVDAALAMRGAIALERQLPLGFDASLAAEVGGMQLPRPGSLAANGWSVGGRLGLYRGFVAGAVSLGPYLAAGASYSRFAAEGATAQAVLPAFEAGAQGRTLTQSRLGLSASLTFTYTPLRATLLGAANELLYRTPLLELRLSVGVGFQGL